MHTQVAEKHPFVTPDGRRFSNLACAAQSAVSFGSRAWVDYGITRFDVHTCRQINAETDARRRELLAREEIARQKGAIQ